MDKDTLADARADFKLCVDAEADQRKESLDDLEFARLGKQWPDDVVRQREKEGRPCLTINRLPAFIKQVTNDARQNRPSITVHPVDSGADKQTAEILNGLIRQIQNVSRADIVYDTALEFAVTMGLGYWVVRDQYTCEDSFDRDLVLERVSNPFSVYGDYESREATSADWNRAFITDFYSESAFKKRWKGADVSGFDADNDDETALWYEDKRIRVAEWWTRDKVPVRLLKMSDGTLLLESKYLEVGDDGFALKDIMDASGIVVAGDRMTDTYKVTQRIISGAQVLETNEWKGKYIPIVPVYGDEINVNGKRYFQSLVRFAKDPARMFNYWRTASTELVALAPKAPFIGPVGAFATDTAKWASANNASHAYIEYDPVPEAGNAPPQRQPFTGVPAGALQEALNASDDMKNIMGLHDASLGARSNETSGRAIMARQREGDVSTFNFVDNLSRAIEHTGAILVDLIPKYYNVPRIIRCIKEDGTNYAVPVNQPVVPVQGQQMPGQPQEQFRPAQPGETEIAGLTKIFDLTTGKYDVTVAAGPSFTSKRQEAAAQMSEFVRAFPPLLQIGGDIMVRNMDWPGASELADRMKAMLPPPAQGGLPPPVQQQMAQMMQQMQGMGQQLQQAKQQLADKTRENELKQAELGLKSREIDIKERDAATKNLVEQTNAEAVRMQQVEIPARQYALDSASLMSAVEAMQGVAALLKPKPRRKQAKATKQPDGSFLMESFESDME